MLRLFAWTFFAIATADLYDKVIGGWQPVKVFPPLPAVRGPYCYTTIVTVTTDHCMCGNKEVPEIQQKHVFLTTHIPILIAETDEQLEEGFNATCICGNVPSKHMIIRYVSDNYMMTYDSNYRNGGVAALLAKEKELPLRADLEDFLDNVDFLKNENGTIYCTKDLDLKKENGSDVTESDLDVKKVFKGPENGLFDEITDILSKILH